LTLAQVAEVIRQSSVDLPGGVLKSGTGELQLRSKHTAYDAEALRDIPVSKRVDGAVIKLGDLAAITDGFDDKIFEYFSNGQPSITIGVKAQTDLVATAEAVRDYVKNLDESLPEGIHYTLRRDNARSFAELLDTLKVRHQRLFPRLPGFTVIHQHPGGDLGSSGCDVVGLRCLMHFAVFQYKPEYVDFIRLCSGNGRVG
jgi:hypothetical protein